VTVPPSRTPPSREEEAGARQKCWSFLYLVPSTRELGGESVVANRNRFARYE